MICSDDQLLAVSSFSAEHEGSDVEIFDIESGVRLWGYRSGLRRHVRVIGFSELKDALIIVLKDNRDHRVASIDLSMFRARGVVLADMFKSWCVIADPEARAAGLRELDDGEQMPASEDTSEFE